MGSNGNAYYCPHNVKPRVEHNSIFTPINIQFRSIPNDGMHMAVNMEPPFDAVFSDLYHSMFSGVWSPDTRARKQWAELNRIEF
jgi:DNA polymerase IIIc chi subunit